MWGRRFVDGVLKCLGYVAKPGPPLPGFPCLSCEEDRALHECISPAQTPEVSMAPPKPILHNESGMFAGHAKLLKTSYAGGSEGMVPSRTESLMPKGENPKVIKVVRSKSPRRPGSLQCPSCILYLPATMFLPHFFVPSVRSAPLQVEPFVDQEHRLLCKEGHWSFQRSLLGYGCVDPRSVPI